MSDPDESYDVDQVPGKGVYACRSCGRHVTIKDDRSPLPPCSVCEDGSRVEYMQVS